MPEDITMDEWQAEMDRVLEAEANGYEPYRRPWSQAELALLTKFYGRVPTKRLAKLLDRTYASLTNRASRIGLTNPVTETNERC